VPDSAFKYIFRRSEGKAIVVVDDAATPAHYSSDSWDVPLLCLECERKLNAQYDGYGIGVFRGAVGASARLDAGVRFSGIDRQRLRMFFLSILWRVSVSSHESYGKIDLPVEWEDQLHESLQRGTNLPASAFTVAVYRLADSSGPKGFSNETLRNFIAAPFARRYPTFVSICFLFLGFMVEIFLPKLPAQHKGQPSVLVGNSPIFLAPYQEILKVPEIMNLFVHGLAKHLSGLSTVR
jgi:hypothetical protein